MTALRTPSYRLHRPSGQGVVRFSGKDIYLGRYNSPESRAEYDRIVAEWLANGRRLPNLSCSSNLPNQARSSHSDMTVNEMLVSYLNFVDCHYRKHGQPTTEVESILISLRPLRHLYGHTLASKFGPLALKTVRQSMIDSGLCRRVVNQRIGRITRAFKWAVSEELISSSVYHGLSAVRGLQHGRCEAREAEPVKPVADVYVDAIRPFVAPPIWAMIELQRLTGMRPGEVCLMRTADIDSAGKVWFYTPETHKTEHHGKERRIAIGPRAQEVLRPWLRAELTAYLFSPRDVMEAKTIERRAKRKTPMTPSQRKRVRKAKPQRTPGERYETHSYYYAIRYAIQAANRVIKVQGQTVIPNWHPNQLRHNAATRLRREFGLDVARTVLGHSSPAVTLVYAEADLEKAAEAMTRVG